MTNQECKNSALAALRGNWAPAVLATIVFVVAAAILSGAAVGPFVAQAPAAAISIEGVGFLMTFLILGPLSVGFANAIKALVDRNDTEIVQNTFRIPVNKYLHIVGGYALMFLKIVLWSLLFLIPGIVKSFAYAMTPYILVDEPELSASQAIKKSKVMMRGHKFDLFYLYLSFAGWFFLCLLTCGIGFFWLEPYTSASVAAFYNDIKADREARQESPFRECGPSGPGK